MVSASSIATPETVTQIENRILKTALAKVGETQMTEWSGSSCSAWEVAECAGSLAVTIAACVASGITWGAALAGCIGSAIGVADIAMLAFVMSLSSWAWDHAKTGRE